MALPVQGINAFLSGAVQPDPVIYEATAYLGLLSVSAYQPVFVIWGALTGGPPANLPALFTLKIAVVTASMSGISIFRRLE